MRSKIIKVTGCIYFLSVIACTDSLTNSDPPENPNIVPAHIVAEADTFIMTKVGELFFKNYITYDAEHYIFLEPDPTCLDDSSQCPEYLLIHRYLLNYKMHIPEKPFVDEIIGFSIDTTGKILNNAPSSGIPNCPENNCWNSFPQIDEDSSYAIASSAGLEDGIEEWRTSFYFYHGDIEDYVWAVSNTLYIIKDDDDIIKVKGGRKMIIHSYSGIVIKISNWEWRY